MRMQHQGNAFGRQLPRFFRVFNGGSMKAIIPAAGLGTRFLPATKSQPKEMLPVVDKPVIQYAVEEAAAGADIPHHYRTRQAGHRGSPSQRRAPESSLRPDKTKSCAPFAISQLAEVFYVRQKGQV
jgi:UTP--glucose-1-phosphate uridylyltransferase